MGTNSQSRIKPGPLPCSERTKISHTVRYWPPFFIQVKSDNFLGNGQRYFIESFHLPITGAVDYYTHPMLPNYRHSLYPCLLPVCQPFIAKLLAGELEALVKIVISLLQALTTFVLAMNAQVDLRYGGARYGPTFRIHIPL